MSDNHHFFPFQNPHPEIAIQTINGYFQIPNSCCPSVKVEERQEQQEQEMIYEKQEYQENHDQEDTEATFALIEQMLLEDVEEQKKIYRMLGSLDSFPDELPRENQRVENLKDEFEEEEKEEFEQEGRLYKWQEDSEEDETEARENALLKLLEERENQEWRDHMMAQRMQQEEEENVVVGLEKLGRGNPYLARRRDKNAEEKCPICLDDIPVETVFYIEGCEHGYHVECLEGHVVTEIDKNIFPIKCPYPDCRAVLTENDVKDSLQTRLEYQIKYEQMMLRVHLDSHPNEYFQCPTPDCKFVCNLLGVKFECPMCKKVYCKECKTDWHNNMSCVQYQEQKGKQTDEAYEESAKSWGYKRCPQCQVFVERTEGCNAMVCSRCQTQFCYTCGKRGDGHNCTH